MNLALQKVAVVTSHTRCSLFGIPPLSHNVSRHFIFICLLHSTSDFPISFTVLAKSLIPICSAIHSNLVFKSPFGTYYGFSHHLQEGLRGRSWGWGKVYVLPFLDECSPARFFKKVYIYLHPNCKCFIHCLYFLRKAVVAIILCFQSPAKLSILLLKLKFCDS